MKHVTFDTVRKVRILRSSDDGYDEVAATVIVWIEGYERPLLCSRNPTQKAFMNNAIGLPLQIYAKLWTSPLRYTDPPMDVDESPTGAPWVVYCERHTSNTPLDPRWFEERVMRSATNSPDAYDAYWEPLSAAWKLKDALKPVVGVVRSRHQPFLQRLQLEPEDLAKGLTDMPFAPINIGEKPCPQCEGRGYVVVDHLIRQDKKILNFGTNKPPPKIGSHLGCYFCDKTGTVPRWSLSVQAGWPPYRCAPQLRRDAVNGDLSQFFLWEVSSNIEREELKDILTRYRDVGGFITNVEGVLADRSLPFRISNTRDSDSGPYIHGVVARVCSGEHDPAGDVIASELQLVIDALEWEAKNAEGVGPVITEPPAKSVDGAVMSGFVDGTNNLVQGNAAEKALSFVKSVLNGGLTRDEARELAKKWREQWPEVAQTFETIAGSLPEERVVGGGRTGIANVKNTALADYAPVVKAIRTGDGTFGSLRELSEIARENSKRAAEHRKRSQFKRSETKKGKHR